MKVYNYLKLSSISLSRDISDEDYADLCEFQEKFFLENWSEIADFYSQPFKSELITELFEGWKTYDSLGYLHRGNAIAVRNNLYMYNLSSWQNPPRTLDDFINDCQRYNIELEWKE